MTYSHNRIAASRNSAERYAHGSSPPNIFFGHVGNGVHSNRKANLNRGAWNRTYAISAASGSSHSVGSGNNAILSPSSVISTPIATVSPVARSNSKHSGEGNRSNNQHQRTNGVQALDGAAFAPGLFGHISPIASLPTITHFAGSKCFDAPAPTALPKPPQHWTSSSSTMSQVTSDPHSLGSIMTTSLRSPVIGQATQIQVQMKSARRALIDDFRTLNLKMLLNVQS